MAGGLSTVAFIDIPTLNFMAYAARPPAFTLGIEAHGVDGCIPGPEAAAV